MKYVYLLISLLLLVGLYLVLGLNGKNMYSDFEKLQKNSSEMYEKHQNKKKRTLKKQIDVTLGRKKKNFFVQSFLDAKFILDYNNGKITMGMIYFASSVLVILGMVISYLADNIFMLVPLSIGLALIPTWVIKIKEISVQKDLNACLETALSGITTSYMRNDNFIQAVEENIKYIDFSIQQPFLIFVSENKLLNSNVEYGIVKLKEEIKNNIFSEWCDAVIQCQSDKGLKVTLFPILNKFSELKNIQAELDTTMMLPLQEFFMLSGIVVMALPLMYFLNEVWFEMLVTTTVGKIIIAFTVFSIFVGASKAVSLCKPLEYNNNRG